MTQSDCFDVYQYYGGQVGKPHYWLGGGFVGWSHDPAICLGFGLGEWLMSDDFMSVDHLVDNAEQRFRFGDHAGGIEYLKQALSVDPDDGFVHSYLAVALINGKRLGAALHEANIGMQLAPNSAFSHFAMGEVLLAKQQFAKASEHLQAAIGLEPENPLFLLTQSRIQVRLKRHEQARELLDRALVLAPDNCDVLVEYGDLMLADNQLDVADDYYHQALSIEPQHIDGLIGKGDRTRQCRQSSFALRYQRLRILPRTGQPACLTSPGRRWIPGTDSVWRQEHARRTKAGLPCLPRTRHGRTARYGMDRQPA